MSSDFESWLSERLSQFNADGDVFSAYILGILDGEESQDEKETNLCDLLEGLGLDDGIPEPSQRLQKEIWSKYGQKSPTKPDSETSKGPQKVDIGAQMAAHAENTTKAFKAR